MLEWTGKVRFIQSVGQAAIERNLWLIIFHLRYIYRSAQIQLECSVNEEVIEISEPSICVYDMVMTTPLACDDALLKKVEDRLKALGVVDLPEGDSGSTSAAAASSEAGQHQTRDEL